ncbi:MAG: cytochrome P450 [Elainella sp.]
MPQTSSLPLPPGTNGLPLIGETLSFFRDPGYAQKKHRRYGPVFKTSLLGKPTVFVRGVEANRFVLSSDRRFVVSWPPSTKALLGNLSLALQTGDVHQNRRKLLAQAFLPRALAGYIDTVEQITHRYLESWVTPGQTELVWYPELRRYTLDVACKLLAGLDNGSETELGHLFETWCAGLFSLPLNLPWTKFGQAKRAGHRLDQVLTQIIQQRQRCSEPGNPDPGNPDPGSDTLGLLVQAKDDDGQSLSSAELNDQVLLLLFAGHETLTSAIASFCLLVGQDAEVLAKLRAEQAQFASLPLTLDSLKQMTYLEQVLREVMRLVPPVGGGFRKVVESCEINGYQIPQGWLVLYQINGTHKDDQLYPEPERFDPERFSPKNLQQQSADRQKYGYLPFGGGIRECLGKEFARLEMKIFAVQLLRGYQWQLLPDQNLDLVTVPTPHPKDGLRVQFSRLV